MTSEQVTEAWNSITNDKKSLVQVAKALDVKPNDLRKALVEAHGQDAVRDTLRANMQSGGAGQKRDGSKLPQFVDRLLAQNPTSADLDTLITNFQLATQKLIDAKNEQ